MITCMSSLPAWLEPLRDVPDAIYGVIAIFTVPILLLIYAARHGAKRRHGLAALMPSIGFRPIAEPSPAELVPELLFHPNGFGDQDADDGGWQDLLPRVPVAWSGQLGQHSVTVMEVTIHRLAYVADLQEERNIQHNLDQTVLRCASRGDDRPPEMLIKEQVLFKSRVKGARTVGGSNQIGAHYFVFSDAPQHELERWINPRLRDALSRHRLWQIATHQGVLYLTRGNSYEKSHEIKSFLEQGEFLLSGLLAGSDETGGLALEQRS